MSSNPYFSSLVKIKLLHSVQAAGKKIRQFEEVQHTENYSSLTVLY